MSEGAQRHGFGLYPGVPSIDFATLRNDDPGVTSTSRKLGAGAAGCVLEAGVASGFNSGPAPIGGPGLAGREDMSTVPTNSTEAVLSGELVMAEGLGVAEWLTCPTSGSASSISNTDKTLIVVFISQHYENEICPILVRQPSNSCMVR